MADNPTVANTPLQDYKVRGTEIPGLGVIQHLRLDLGTGTSELQVTSSNPLPVANSAPVASSVTESSYSVTTSSSMAVAANASRKGGYIQNISDTDMYISWGSTATTTTKTKLFSGASMPLQITNLVYTGAIYAIHGGTGTKTLVIVQVT